MWKIGLVCFLFTWTLTTHGKYSASGDEPHYLMIAHSLTRDHDLDLANNYAQDDGRWFGHDHLQAGPHVRVSRGGRLLSVHDVGLPALLVPIYFVAQRIATVPSPDLLSRFRMTRGLFAYSVIGLFLIGATAWAMTLLGEGLEAEAFPVRVGALVALIAISPPILSHAFLVFPEVPALVVTSLAVWFATKRQHPDDRDTMLGLIALIGFLPWVHRKYTLYSIGLLFVVLWSARSARRELSTAQRWTAGALFVAPQVAFYAWTWREWGAFGGPQLADALPFSVHAFGDGIAGLWLDRQSGLLAYAPLYWIVPVSWAMTWRRTWPFLVPALLLYVPMASFVEWWGGFSPAARYLVPIVPLCAVPMALALRSTILKIAMVFLALAQLAIDAVVWQHPRALWPQDSGGNPALELLGAAGRTYERLLPAIRVDGLTAHAIAIVIVLIGVVVLAAMLSRSEEDVRPWPLDVRRA